MLDAVRASYLVKAYGARDHIVGVKTVVSVGGMVGRWRWSGGARNGASGRYDLVVPSSHPVRALFAPCSSRFRLHARAFHKRHCPAPGKGAFLLLDEQACQENEVSYGSGVTLKY